MIQPKGPPRVHGDFGEEAAEFFRDKRWQGPSDFPVDRYLRAREHGRRLPLVHLERDGVRAGFTAAASSSPALGTWQPLGPGNIGGRTRALVTDPGNPNTMYAGTATGGVWKTLDGGQSWKPLTGFFTSSFREQPGDAPVELSDFVSGNR